MIKKKQAFQKSFAIGVLPLTAISLFTAGATQIGLGAATGYATEQMPEGDPSAIEAPGSFLDALKQREMELEELYENLNKREIAVNEAEKKLTEKLKQLEEAEKKLLNTLSLTKDSAEQDVRHLVTVYETIKPERAAALFSAMEINFAASLLARLSPEHAGQILASLEPTTAYAITVVIAGRNALATRQ